LVAYWGASGENIDTASGNLNFSMPLITPFSRGIWGIAFMLNYNSQMWRHSSGAPGLRAGHPSRHGLEAAVRLADPHLGDAKPNPAPLAITQVYPPMCAAWRIGW
jgi:hypothetical protein